MRNFTIYPIYYSLFSLFSLLQSIQFIQVILYRLEVSNTWSMIFLSIFFNFFIFLLLLEYIPTNSNFNSNDQQSTNNQREM